MAQDRKGYGVVKTEKKVERAHRVAYRLATGKALPSSVFLCHSCDNRLCCNPAHLFEGSNADNMRDARSKGRTAKGPASRGEAMQNSKLTETDVRRMRALYRPGVMGFKKLGKIFGVNCKTAANAIRGVKWSHVK